MPRTRLVWHLFAGWCGLVLALLGGFFSLSSVQLARLADDAARQRLVDAALALARTATTTDGTIDAAAFRVQSREAAGAVGADFELYSPAGAPFDTATADSAAVREPRLLEAAARGGIASGSRYDAASGRRLLTVAVPYATAGRPAAIVQATAETTTMDAGLAAAQRTLFLRSLAVAALAAAAGYLLARRAAQPVHDLCTAAARLAGGDVDVPIPSTDLAELADLSAALDVLRGQVVESGITIGRQDTQQEAVLGSMIEGVLAIDARQRVVGINRAAAELLGLDLKNVLRRPLQDAVRNPDLRRFALRAIDCREPVEDDLVLHGVRDRTIRLRGTALRDVSGEGGAVIVLNDVTEMKRLESIRRDFVANVSHELKTPVASIKGFVETLLDGAAQDPTDAQRFLEIIARQADRLAAIIEDLLALSRIEQSEDAGNLPLEPVPIAGVFAAVAADCGLRAREQAIQIETSCPDDLVAEVNAPLLEQAVLNLVDNAIKYTDTGRTIWVTATAEPGGDGRGDLVIRVRDEGCGIEAEHLPRLFERFYRVDKARSRKQGGTGLGLSIVKHIVQAHAGTVGVESTPGVGSSFTIRLPLASRAVAHRVEA